MKVLYDSNSWMTHLIENDFIEAAVGVEYKEDAGHHIYADQYNRLNQAVNMSLTKYDQI